MYPPPPNKSAASGALKDLVASARQRAAHSLASRCVSNTAALIRPEKGELPTTELQAIFEDCAEFAWTLWVQKNRIRILDVDAIRRTLGEDNRELRFAHRSSYLDAHSLHNRELDRAENMLDGKPVLLLTSPAIVSAGLADGADYEHEKVLKKGVAWMG